METSALFKIILTFAGVLVANRLRTPLGLALVFGGIALDLWSGHGIAGTGADLFQSVLQPELWLLIINITLILEIGHFMASEGNAKTIISAAKNIGGRHSHWLSLILIPATIGLVPMPGGALFSAPLIARTAADMPRSEEWKASVNYWFRHILEYWWPLYPVVIVTLSIFPVPTWQYMALFIPFTLASVAAGYFFLIHRVPAADVSSPRSDDGAEKLLPVLLPILIIVGATLVLPGLFTSQISGVSTPAATMLAMLSGLLVALSLIHFRARPRPAAAPPEFRLFANLFTGKTANVILTLAGVMIFQEMLSHSELLPLAGTQLATSRVPLFGIIAILPFLAGLVTGIAVGFAGISFPLVAGLVSLPSAGTSPLAALALAFTMGYCGMMLSPVHLCFVLTKDFFSVPFAKVYILILPCVLAIMTTGSVLYLLLNSLGW